MNTLNFPQYRKHKNSKNFYKIHHEKKFEEIQLIGTRTLHYTIEAKQFPEMIRILDMLRMEDSFRLSEETEWNSVFARVAE